MVRGRVEMKKIQNPVNRRVTFSKRKRGLLKKAQELSLLCDAHVALIIFSPSGKMFESASPSMNRIIGKYQKNYVSEDKLELSEDIEALRLDLEYMQKRISDLEKRYENMIGEDLDCLSLKDLQCLEKQLSLGARRIWSTKEKKSLEYIRSLKLKAKSLILENSDLVKKRKPLVLENSHLAEKVGRNRTPCHLTIDIMERVNDSLETDAATQQDITQPCLNLTLSQAEGTCGTFSTLFEAKQQVVRNKEWNS